MSEPKKLVLGLDTIGLSDEDIQHLEQVANTQFNFGIKLIRKVSIEDLARAVSRKCLERASDLLDEKVNCVNGDGKLVVRYLVETAVEANKLIPHARNPMIRIGDPPHSHSEADKRALADAIREILMEQAGANGDPKYE